MKSYENPYEECSLCKTLADCKHVEKGEGLCMEMPPDNCPKPTEVLRHTLHKRKLDRNKKYS